MGNRKAFTDYVIKYMDRILPGAECIQLFKSQLEAMTDEQFESYVTDLEQGKQNLHLTIPNGGKHQISIERNFEVAKEVGVEFFQQLRLTDPVTKAVYLTPKKYLVVDLVVRRQAQLLVKKQSIPEDNLHVDQLTDQPTGVSKGAKISFPELQILGAQEMDVALHELISIRGGNRKAYNLMRRTIIESGSVRQAHLANTGTRAKAIDVMGILLNGMHLHNNI
jgi:hypothetical protein